MGAGEPSLRHAAGHGRVYAARQQAFADRAATVDAWKFEGCVGPADTVIDFGCGSGALLDLLPGQRKLGVEINAEARATAASRGHETYARSTDLPDQAADAVVSHHALEHTVHPRAELAELYRALKPGGYLYLWLPIDDWRAQRSPTSGLDKDHHLYTWTPRLIANLLTEAGFRVERAEVVADAWPPRWPFELHQALPRLVFRALSFLTAVALRRRQLRVVARKASG